METLSSSLAQRKLIEGTTISDDDFFGGVNGDAKKRWGFGDPSPFTGSFYSQLCHSSGQSVLFCFSY